MLLLFLDNQTSVTFYDNFPCFVSLTPADI